MKLIENIIIIGLVLLLGSGVYFSHQHFVNTIDVDPELKAEVQVESIMLEKEPSKEEELEMLRELRFEPEYYQDSRKMNELDQQIDDVHNEINAMMELWEEYSEMIA